MNGSANASEKLKEFQHLPCFCPKSTTVFRLVTVTAVLLLTGFFRANAQTHIVICIKPQKLPSECKAMSEHVSWTAKWSKTESVDALKQDLATKMNAGTTDEAKKLVYVSSDKQYACILSFTVQERFTGCKRNLYACGFGNNEAEALEEATTQVQLYTLNDFLVDNHFEVSSKINTNEPYE